MSCCAKTNVIVDEPQSPWIFVLPSDKKKIREKWPTKKDFIVRGGKWLVFGRERPKLDELAKKLEPYVESGKIPAVKYLREPSSLGRGRMVMCVYCDEKEKEEIWKILEGLGIKQRIWKPNIQTVKDWLPGGRLYEKIRKRGENKPEARKMKREERIEVFKERLLKITREGGSGNFVIFKEPTTGKFIQFAGERGKQTVLCDIPGQQLTRDQTEKLVSEGFSRQEMRSGLHPFEKEVQKILEEESIAPETLNEMGRKRDPKFLETVVRISEKLLRNPKCRVSDSKELFPAVVFAVSRLATVRVGTLMGYTYNKRVEVEEAAELSERIFREIFNLPPDYCITATLQLE